MAISFIDADKALRKDLQHNISSKNELRKFSSVAPTLNNTPTISRHTSRNNSPDRHSASQMESTTLPKETLRIPSRNEHSTEDLSNQKESNSSSSSFCFQQLDSAWMGGVIIVCFFTSGLIDAVAFNSWNCFVGMQTGNTIFAALGLGGQPTAAHPQQYYKSLVAIGSFCLGTLFFNFMHRWPTGLHNQPTTRTRILFVTSFFIQTILIIIPAALVTTGVVSNQPFISGVFSSGSHTQRINPDHLGPNYKDLVPISILAFEAAGQVCLSRVLSLIELPTIVLSTLYHDFTADLYTTRHLWRKSSSIKDFILVQHRRQQKRLFSIFALFIGGIVGGEMYKSSAGMGGALWLAAGLKAGITIAFALWRKEKAVVPDSPV